MRKNSRQLRESRRQRIRHQLHGTAARPRLSVFRSNRGLVVQIIDDDLKKTLVAASVLAVAKDSVAKADQAYELGLEVAKLAKGVGLKQIVFDRGGYLFHGRVAALARGAREGGLSF